MRDSSADIDANFVMNDQEEIVELQLTGEQTTCSESQLNEMMTHSKKTIQELIFKQKEALGA